MADDLYDTVEKRRAYIEELRRERGEPADDHQRLAHMLSDGVREDWVKGAHGIARPMSRAEIENAVEEGRRMLEGDFTGLFPDGETKVETNE